MDRLGPDEHPRAVHVLELVVGQHEVRGVEQDGLVLRPAEAAVRPDQPLERVHHPNEEVTIALVGKYVELPDAYLSVV